MKNSKPYSRWLGYLLLGLSIFPGTISVAANRDGIRMWRDRNGVLNISNVWVANRTMTYPRIAPTISMPKPVADTVSMARPQAAPARRDFTVNIYTYTDSAGVKHFTNLPSGNQPYRLALSANFYGSLSSRNSISAQRSIYDGIVAEAARTYQVDQSLVRAMIHAESAFNPLAISPKGAVGLMQLMPDTAQRYGVQDAFNPSDNVYGGVRYLRDLLKMFDNNLALAIAAYNAGENAVTRHGGIPPYAETTNYVQRVLSLHNRYQNSTN